jgi:MerR family transcriptional regulator, light-induced transcriptional regulator
MTIAPDSRPQFPIGTVARRTGLTTHLLRAWERRYGVVAPVRTQGGTRLYSNADIFRLRLLRRAVDAGQTIGRIAELSNEALLRLAEEAVSPGEARERTRASLAPERLVVECLEAVEGMDGARIHALLTRAAILLSSGDFTDRVVVPLLRRVGELWEAGTLCPAHEHLLSANLQRVLAWLLGSVPGLAGAPGVVVTTPAGHRHELAALLAALEAMNEGWRVTYLGPDLPAADVATATTITGASAVLLSVVRETSEEELVKELAVLRQRIGEGVPVLIGGQGAGGHEGALEEAGATFVADFAGLRAILRALDGTDHGSSEGSDGGSGDRVDDGLEEPRLASAKEYQG